MLNNAYQTLKRNNQTLLSQLNTDDQRLIHNIMSRLNTLKINSIKSQILQRDLIGMAQEHQLRGTSLTRELGDGVSDFANDLYSSSPTINWSELIVNFLVRLSGFLFAWLLFGSLFLYGGFTWKTSPSIVFFYSAIVVASYGIELFLTPYFLFKKGALQALPQLISLLSFFIIGALFLRLNIFKNLTTFNTVPLLVLFGSAFSVLKLIQTKLLHHLSHTEAHLFD